MSTLNDLKWNYTDELVAKRRHMLSVTKDWCSTECYAKKVKTNKVPKVAQRLFELELRNSPSLEFHGKPTTAALYFYINKGLLPDKSTDVVVVKGRMAGTPKQINDKDMRLAHQYLEHRHSNRMVLNEEDWRFFESVVSKKEKDEVGARRDEKNFQRLKNMPPVWQ